MSIDNSTLLVEELVKSCSWFYLFSAAPSITLHSIGTLSHTLFTHSITDKETFSARFYTKSSFFKESSFTAMIIPTYSNDHSHLQK
jgi:hypothetical protein